MEQHLKTIEQPFIIEILDECFDNISTMLTDNAVVYGSSITSIISGLPANGDLDIAVSHMESMTLCKRFANSSKWKQIAGDTIMETDFSVRGLPRMSSRDRLRPPSSISSTSKFSDRKSYRNISAMATFETVGNKHVQIIQAKKETNDPLSDALSIVRAVDFVFCGIAIDKHGKIFEVIKSALDDCKQKIIRVANYHSRLTERFNKYIKRGWGLGISIDQANQNYLKQKRNKKVERQSDERYAEVIHGKNGYLQLRFLSPMSKKLTPDELHNLVTSTAKNDFGIYLKVIPMTATYIENIKVKGHRLTNKIAVLICEKIVFKFKKRFFTKKKSKFRHHDDYREAAKFTVNPLCSSDLFKGIRVNESHKVMKMDDTYSKTQTHNHAKAKAEWKPYFNSAEKVEEITKKKNVKYNNLYYTYDDAVTYTNDPVTKKGGYNE